MPPPGLDLHVAAELHPLLFGPAAPGSDDLLADALQSKLRELYGPVGSRVSPQSIKKEKM